MRAVARYGLAVFAATCALLAVASVALHRPGTWFAVAAYAALVVGFAVFERGRYRPRAPLSPVWRATGERFFDPATGAATEVYYDSKSGARDYRTG